MDRLESMEMVFAGLFFTANSLQRAADRYMSDSGITVRQWMLLAVISRGKAEGISIGEAADALSTSHQNVKQLTLTLEKSGWVSMRKNPQDNRIILLSLTEKCRIFFKNREEQDRNYLINLFSGYNDEEMENFAGYLLRFYNKTSGLNIKVKEVV